jgi:hypothetical protein
MCFLHWFSQNFTRKNLAFLGLVNGHATVNHHIMRQCIWETSFWVPVCNMGYMSCGSILLKPILTSFIQKNVINKWLKNKSSTLCSMPSWTSCNCRSSNMTKIIFHQAHSVQTKNIRKLNFNQNSQNIKYHELQVLKLYLNFFIIIQLLS